MPIRILATADLHLGKASADVSGHFAATKHTWETVVNWAIAHAVDVVALCGDIVDRDNRYFEAVGPLQDGLEKLGKNGIEVFMVSGNHDHDVLPGILRSRQLDNVHLLGANGTWELYSYTKAGETIQFAGWSFPRLIVQESAMTGWQLPGHDPNYPVIGLLHGDIDKTGSGSLDTWSHPQTGSIAYPFAASMLYRFAPCLKRQRARTARPGIVHGCSRQTGNYGTYIIIPCTL
jgi:exonuclease SbcD